MVASPFLPTIHVYQAAETGSRCRESNCSRGESVHAEASQCGGVPTVSCHRLVAGAVLGRPMSDYGPNLTLSSGCRF